MFCLQTIHKELQIICLARGITEKPALMIMAQKIYEVASRTDEGHVTDDSELSRQQVEQGFQLLRQRLQHRHP
ncbi:hypothetical protein MPTK1_3g21100 [Marchantia polymorpha subsp. ruderalis]|uniref:Uncharacterized protein n=2 Tax=Marchantia polymorpha TaxID=3197 RepID=A0AAF6B348_MARPO|nr:hypothetical protein MARPO_0160s0005 [Marchantia polymorpha]BBN06432.1 hypothetical protein Mp_3g21100 [Marchantia polymorpha subsp. ruderalis]|eukprot:PTQ28552.1 hypothetical protein MARPO_0160s0005 [Marchantia polymorpha]